ncbi:MAG: TrbI/VirB10 family protein [Desulfobacula sp.]|jgi:type IV secretion system protein TrbI|nr:TrbI/VirB10 family protein [Desulfobacula sp.]
MEKTLPVKRLKEGWIISLAALIVIVLLGLILTPILSSSNKKSIRITSTENLPMLKNLPKTYADIEPEKQDVKQDIKDPDPPVQISPSPPISYKPNVKYGLPVNIPPKPQALDMPVVEDIPVKEKPAVIIPIKRKVHFKPVRKVTVKPKKIEPTKLEKAVAKGVTSGIGFASFKAVKLKPKKKEARNSIKGSLKRPGSKYMIQAGTNISAITVSAINSDLPGHVIARVDRNVFNSVTGDHLLIPQSSKLIGNYSSNLKLNQKRIQVIWKEIKLPDGSTVDLGKGQPGVGNQGMSGVAGNVDNHFFSNAASIFSVALLNSSAKQISNASNGTLKDDVSGDVASDVANAGSDVFKEQIQLGPTIKIPIASKIKILIINDLEFEEAYNAEPF